MGVFLYQQSHLQIYADEEGWICAAWMGLQSEAEVRKGSEEILNHAKRRGATTVLNDQTQLQGTWMHASSWIALDWIPRLRSDGVNWIAWVYATRFVELAVQMVRAKAPSGMIECFHNTTDAAAWLRDRLNDRRRSQKIILPPRAL